MAEVPDSFGVENYSTPPPVVPAPSHSKTATTSSADPGHHPTDIDVAQDRSNTNTNTLLARVDDFFEEHGGCDMDDLFPPSSQEPNVGAKDSSHPSRSAEMNSNNKRRLFSSQETPPAADFTETQPIAEVRSVISPNTLKKACEEENAVPVKMKPKGRKRKKKDDKSASQPLPIRAQDGPLSEASERKRNAHASQWYSQHRFWTSTHTRKGASPVPRPTRPHPS